MQLFWGEESGGLKGFVAAHQIVRHVVFSWEKINVFKDLREFAVAGIAWNLVCEIFHEIMNIPFLYDFRRMEDDAMFGFPEATLGNEALPYVAHSERAVAGNIHAREGLREPPRGLRVERTPYMWAEADGWRVVEIKRTVFRKPPDGVNIRR